MNFETILEKNYDGYKSCLLNKLGKQKKLCLFGKGGFGQATADELLEANIPVSYFIDNNKNKIGTVYREIECVSLETIVEDIEDYFILITMANPGAIIKQLKDNGIKCYDAMSTPYKLKFDQTLLDMGSEKIQKKINTVYDVLEDEKSKQVLQNMVKSWYQEEYDGSLYGDIFEENQYFSKDIVSLDNETVFVDCGAFIGDSLQSFLKNVNETEFKKAILFEMNELVCQELRNNIQAWCAEDVRNKIKIINKGVSNENADISYVLSTSSSHIDGEGTQKGQIVRMDDELADERVTMIKMDIEGCEMDALRGCRNLIIKNKPTLAICVYHKLADMWEIPLFLKEILPEYKIYLRHYTHTQTETVCFAVYDK